MVSQAQSLVDMGVPRQMLGSLMYNDSQGTIARSHQKGATLCVMMQYLQTLRLQPVS
jgi:hypothetical protein